MNAPNGRLPAIVGDVERRLAGFYGFAPKAAAVEHLVTREQLRLSLGDRVAELPEYQARAGVFLVDAAGESDLFIGIHFGDDVKQALDAADPTSRLDEANLDAFCVVVEEVSHFHLILNRADLRRGVSKLELEWQGEVDKLLICASLLEAQAGEAHIVPLARKLYDLAVITSQDQELYWEATRHAARFWFNAVRQSGRLSPELRTMLRRSYEASWSEKLAQLDAEQRRAS